jgi:hypothetical protein
MDPERAHDVFVRNSFGRVGSSFDQCSGEPAPAGRQVIFEPEQGVVEAQVFRAGDIEIVVREMYFLTERSDMPRRHSIALRRWTMARALVRHASISTSLLW